MPAVVKNSPHIVITAGSAVRIVTWHIDSEVYTMKKNRFDDQVMFSVSKAIALKMLEEGMYTSGEYDLAIILLAEKYTPYISQLTLDK